MKYYKYNAEQNPIILYNNPNNIIDCLFELNSSEIQQDILNTITYLLLNQYNIQNNKEKESDLNEILRLIKFGLLKVWPYNSNTLNYPLKYQPSCTCYK